VQEHPPPFLAHSVGEEGGLGGKVRGLPSPPVSLPRCGRGVIWFVNAASVTDTGAGSPLLRSPPPSATRMEQEGGLEGRCGSTLPTFLSRSVGEEGGLGGR
jgi:hypothetical protein